MKKIILASHGGLAEGMKDTVKMLSGIDEGIYAFGFRDGGDINEIFCQVNELINDEDEFIVVTDAPGGSVNTVLTPLVNHENVQLIAGMNTILVVSLAMSLSADKEDILQSIEEGKGSIVYVNELLEDKEESGDFFD